MKQISIIVPFLNEKEWPYKTIQSIYDTADSNLFEIIAINENLKDNYDFTRFPDVKYIKNESRLGVDACRQLGVETATTDKILILDSHTLFYPNSNWLNKVINCVEREPTTAWCFTCVSLWGNKMDIYNHCGKYYGADFLLFDKNADPKRFSRECLEPKWKNKLDMIEYEIPTILGANYAFSKDFFMHIRGLRGLQMWGSSEIFLSLKAFMAGGTSKINTEVETCHLFRENAPYVTQIYSLYVNKVLICKTILPDEIGNKVIDCLPKDINFKKAMDFIEQHKDEIESERKYYQSIFRVSFYDYCKKFNIALPQ